MGLDTQRNAFLQDADAQIVQGIIELQQLSQRNSLLEVPLEPILRRLIAAQQKLQILLSRGESSHNTASQQTPDALFSHSFRGLDKEFLVQVSPSIWQRKLEAELQYGGRGKFFSISSDERSRYAVERVLKIPLTQKTSIFRAQLVLIHQLVQGTDNTTTSTLLEQQSGYKSFQTQASSINNGVLYLSPWKVTTSKMALQLIKKEEPSPSIQPEDDVLVERFQAVWEQQGLVKTDDPRTLLRQGPWESLIQLYRFFIRNTLPFTIDKQTVEEVCRLDVKQCGDVTSLFNQLFPEWNLEYIWGSKKYTATSTGKAFQKPVES